MSTTWSSNRKRIGSYSCYINDAVFFGLPFIWDASYRFNRDSGFVVVKKLRRIGIGY